jgi:hypothetical protein
MGPDASDKQQVLDRDRHAGQRAGNVPGGPGGRCTLGFGSRRIVHVGDDHIAQRVSRFERADHLVDDVDRREAAGAIAGNEIGCGQAREIECAVDSRGGVSTGLNCHDGF